ncbi:Ig-like domain-containing protein, partial [Candidatus Accumulibacter vicinus]|uniref:Ig-like domain-containing protein n=1 Tax=Candidatus Accumulibacter vicinus TaxID=2954382 RepID=UPI00235B6EFA
MTAPAAGASYVAPAAITLTATAADTDGTITQVEFFQGTTLIGTATAAPYSFAWNSVPAGSYS